MSSTKPEKSSDPSASELEESRDWGGLIATLSALAILGTFIWAYMEHRLVKKYGQKKRRYIAWRIVCSLSLGAAIFALLQYLMLDLWL